LRNRRRWRNWRLSELIIFKTAKWNNRSQLSILIGHSRMRPRKIEVRNEINLIGVNNEKEPLTGMSPVKWLFERSLHSTWKEDNVTFLLYIYMMLCKYKINLV
jgi:hypothetical protein